MLKVGLTGGIGCGKTTATSAFRALGVSVIDADAIAKDIVKLGSVALDDIRAQFGDDVVYSHGKNKGELNRAFLKEKVFSDKDALEILEKIIHPQIKKEIKQQIALQDDQDVYVVIDVPLLLEKNYTDLFDRIIVVDCKPNQQLERVAQRDQLDEKIIKKIMDAQARRDSRLTIATDILDNTRQEKDLVEQIYHLHQQFLASS